MKEEEPIIEKIREALRRVSEPEMGKDLVSLGMVEDIRFSGGVASFKVLLTTPDCPFRDRIMTDCENAASVVREVEEVRVELDARPDEKWRSHPLFTK